MTIAEELMEAYDQGKDAYLEAIRAQGGYETLLQKLRETRPERSWIQSPIAIPKFTTPEFEKKRKAYEEKYGSRIQVPGFEDIIQWRPRVPISNEEMAAHKYAQRYGMPSPLSKDQLDQLQHNRALYLRLLSSPENIINRNATAIMTAMDNANDALFTFALLGQVGTRLAPKLLGRAVPIFGWAQGAADVLNLFNVAAMVSSSRHAKKRILEKELDKNPFHRKFWTERTERFGKKWPGLGALLQVPQVSQNMFGVGLCLGGIMGMMNDVLYKGAEQLTALGVNIAVTLQYPSAYRDIWADAIDSALLVWNAKDWVDKQDLETVTLAASKSMWALTPTWLQVDTPEFLDVMQKSSRRLPKVKSPILKYLAEEFGQDPSAQPKWPYLETEAATLEDITYTYGPMVTKSLQDYLRKNPYDWGAMLIGESAVDIHGNIITALSDDHTAKTAQTAISGAVKDMAIYGLNFAPGTSKDQIDRLGIWITDYEVRSGQQPGVKEIKALGEKIGIRWQTTPPKPDPEIIKQIFPDYFPMKQLTGQHFEPYTE